MFSCYLLLTGAQLDARAEADRVNGRLRRVAEIVGRDTTSFWSDSARGRVLALQGIFIAYVRIPFGGFALLGIPSFSLINLIVFLHLLP